MMQHQKWRVCATKLISILQLYSIGFKEPLGEGWVSIMYFMLCQKRQKSSYWILIKEISLILPFDIDISSKIIGSTVWQCKMPFPYYQTSICMEKKKAVHVSSLVDLCFYVHRHILKLYYNKLSQGLKESLNEGWVINSEI